MVVVVSRRQAPSSAGCMHERQAVPERRVSSGWCVCVCVRARARARVYACACAMGELLLLALKASHCGRAEAT